MVLDFDLCCVLMFVFVGFVLLPLVFCRLDCFDFVVACFVNWALCWLVGLLRGLFVAFGWVVGVFLLFGFGH